MLNCRGALVYWECYRAITDSVNKNVKPYYDLHDNVLRPSSSGVSIGNVQRRVEITINQMIADNEFTL